MTLALIILALLFALQTVRVWIYKRAARIARARAERRHERIKELELTIAGARVVNNLLIGEVNKDEWPEILG